MTPDIFQRQKNAAIAVLGLSLMGLAIMIYNGRNMCPAEEIPCPPCYHIFFTHPQQSSLTDGNSSDEAQGVSTDSEKAEK